MKDYYATLGVTPQAEDIVIKAAYRALAQRYHPDRAAEVAQDATKKMAEINEAYSILSDPAKRKVYDAEYLQAGGNEGDFEAGDQAAAEGGLQVTRDWQTALDYYPDLKTIEADLAKTSKSLAFTFRLFVISERSFKDRHAVATKMHDLFIRSYFGANAEIVKFAKTLINQQKKEAARALNEAVRIFGDEIEPTVVISRIKQKFGIIETTPLPQNDSEGLRFLNLVRRGDSQGAMSLLGQDLRYLEFKDESTGNTALHFAIIEKNLPLAKALFDRGASAAVENKFHATPIEFAKRMKMLGFLAYVGVEP